MVFRSMSVQYSGRDDTIVLSGRKCGSSNVYWSLGWDGLGDVAMEPA